MMMPTSMPRSRAPSAGSSLRTHRMALAAIALLFGGIFLFARVALNASGFPGPSAIQPITRHVLIIGIDGMRPDAMEKARTPNLHRLIASGSFTPVARCHPERDTGADTVSGPGWSSILTGVWPDKHLVTDNKFTTNDYKHYPHFFKRLRDADSGAFLASVSSWTEIARRIATDANLNIETNDSDDLTVEMGAEILARKRPRALFLHFDDVDNAGHDKGFSPDVPEYIEAIETTDGRVGRLLAVIDGMPQAERSKWLVIVCSDHGGLNTDHAGGLHEPVVFHVGLIISGEPAQSGTLLPADTCNVDIVPTVLTHLGVTIDPAWKLDGVARGLKEKS